MVCQAVVVNGQPIRPDRQLHGTAGDDLAIPAAGDDAIVYTSGALVIADTPPDCGRDHAALGRHDTRNLTFQPGGPDLLVGPPDGPIRIENQLATEAGQLERRWLGNQKVEIWIEHSRDPHPAKNPQS